MFAQFCPKDVFSLSPPILPKRTRFTDWFTETTSSNQILRYIGTIKVKVVYFWWENFEVYKIKLYFMGIFVVKYTYIAQEVSMLQCTPHAITVTCCQGPKLSWLPECRDLSTVRSTVIIT